MRNTMLSVAIAIVVCGTAKAADGDVATFVPLDLPGGVSKMSPNGAWIAATDPTGLPGYRYNMKTGETETIQLGLANGISNDGTLIGSIYANGSPMNGGPDTGAYVPAGSTDPILISNPIREVSSGYGMSDNGILVGLSSTANGTLGLGAAYAWTAADGMKLLPDNRPARAARASGISTDGHVIYGWNDTNGFRSGVVWVDGSPVEMTANPNLPYGEASGISANDQFVVGNFAYDTISTNGAWRWNRADGSVTFIPGMDYAFAVTNDGKTVVGNISSNNPTQTQRMAMIWQEGVGTMRLADWLTAHGGSLPDGFNVDLQGGVLGITGDGTTMAGWVAVSPTTSFLIQVTPDKIFADDFDRAAPLNAYMTIAPATILKGTPSTLTIVLDNPGKADATLTQDFVAAFPSGMVVASTPNVSTSCGSATLSAYPGYEGFMLHAGATIAANAHCTVSVSVTSNDDGDYTYVIPTGTVVTNAGQNPVDASATLHVLAGGNGVVRVAAANHVLVDSTTGTSVNFVTGVFNDAGPSTGAWDLNLYDGKNTVNTTNNQLTLKTIATYNTGLAVDANNAFVALNPGDVVGPSTNFTYAAKYFNTLPDWLAGKDGYFGFRFQCGGRLANPVAGGFCYGYAHLTTTAAATGYPATLVGYAFDGDGKAITVQP